MVMAHLSYAVAKSRLMLPPDASVRLTFVGLSPADEGFRLPGLFVVERGVVRGRTTYEERVLLVGWASSPA
jgi:hypothetical protein